MEFACVRHLVYFIHELVKQGVSVIPGVPVFASRPGSWRDGGPKGPVNKRQGIRIGGDGGNYGGGGCSVDEGVDGNSLLGVRVPRRVCSNGGGGYSRRRCRLLVVVVVVSVVVGARGVVDVVEEVVVVEVGLFLPHFVRIGDVNNVIAMLRPARRGGGRGRVEIIE